MQIDVTNGKRFTEYDALAAVASEEDVLLVRLADGTGVKRIPISAIKAFINGDLDTLETEDKTSLIAAINEVFGLVGTNAQDIKALKELTAMLGQTGASRANSFIYEHDLGTSFTAEQSADIRAGKFAKVRTGGYWTINGRKYWAAHADYRLHCGDVELTTHHMLVFPDKNLYTGKMNTNNDTTGAYFGSEMYTTGLASALETIKKDFGADHILTYKNLLTNAVANGASSAWAWYERQLDLMNEQMVYGSHAWGGGSQNGFDTGCDKTQLALFQARPDLICNRENWWLRDVRSVTRFCGVSDAGNAYGWGASSVFGVRPAFLVY